MTAALRLLVSEVIARIQAGAEFSFDFLLLLVLAGIIAFMGLMESSSVVLVASMLVSPLMGPILAGIFGGAVNDSGLSWVAVRHEVYSLMICILQHFAACVNYQSIRKYCKHIAYVLFWKFLEPRKT